MLWGFEKSARRFMQIYLQSLPLSGNFVFAYKPTLGLIY